MSGVLHPNGITVRRGDSFTINLHFKDEIGNIDLTGFKLKLSAATEKGVKVLEKEGVVSDALHGLAVIELLPKDTDIAEGCYQADIQINLPNGQIHTIYPQNINSLAYLKITPQITE